MQKGKNLSHICWSGLILGITKIAFKKTQANMPTEILTKSFPYLVHLLPLIVNMIAQQNEHRKEAAKNLEERRKEKTKT